MIKNNQKTEPYYFKEGCYITELWNEKQDEEVSIARVILPAGQKTRPHYLLHTHERYLIIRGQGKVKIDNHPDASVLPGDIVFIAAGQWQWIENTSEDQDLEFHAICTPRFKLENYFDS